MSKAGQIISRGTNTWLVRVFLGRDEANKRKYHNKTIHGTKKDAQKYLNSVLREKDLGSFVEPSKMTVNQYLNHWLEVSAKAKLRERTYSSYVETLKLYVQPHLGQKVISKLSPLDIQTLYSTLQENGLSASTIKRAHAVLSSALRQGVKWQMIPKNPSEYVDLPRIERKEMKAFTAEEAKRFLDAAVFDKLNCLFVLLLTTGLRPGEALGLKWTDLVDGKLQIQRALVRNGKGWSLEEPKTSRSRRVVPIPKTALQVLQQHKIEQAKEQLKEADYNNLGFIFAANNGHPLNERNIVNRHFKPILKKAGLPESFRLYDLRHTCATLLLAAGENPKIVAERLGHASVTLTLDTYSHVLPDMQQKATEKLEKMLF